VFVVSSIEGQAVALEVDALFGPVCDFVAQLYERPMSALGGYPLGAIPGMEMSPGMWARVEKRTQDFLGRRSFNDDPRTVISAAINAVAQKPETQASVARAALRAMARRGDTPLPGLAVETSEAWSQASPLSMTEVTDAIVLRELLGRRGGLGRQRRGPERRRRTG
jgi:hypothetical protein